MRPRSLVVVFAVAFVARLVYLLTWRGSLLDTVLLGDARIFDEWGQELASGNWLGTEIYYQAPLYPHVLGVIYTLVGRDLFLVRILQAILGAAGCTLVAASTARLASPRTGLVAGLLGAVYLPWIWADGLLQKTSLALFLSTLFVFLLLRALERPGRRRLLVAGLALGLLTLTRENALVLVLPALLLLRRPADAPDRPRALWMLGGLALALAPVATRNLVVGGALLPTTSNFGVNLYLGNGPDADGFYVPLVAGRGHADFEYEDARRQAEAQAGRSLTPTQVSFHFVGETFSAIFEDPLRWLALLTRKSRLVLDRREAMDAESLEAYLEESGLLPLRHVTSFGVLLGLALVGLVSARTVRGVKALALCSLYLAASLVLFFVAARFRLGLVPFLLPVAAIGTLALLRRASLALVTLALAGLLLSYLGPRLDGDPRATTWANVASELLRQGRDRDAETVGTRALGYDPDSDQALFNRGLARKQLGDLDGARRDFAAILVHDSPFAADAAAELGAIAALRDDPATARHQFDRVLEVEPRHARANYYLGLLMRSDGRDEAAGVFYGRALESEPDFPEPRHNLGILREEAGDIPGAAALYEEALRRTPDFRPSRIRLAWIRAVGPEAERNPRQAHELALGLLGEAGERDPDLELLRAVALASLGRYPAATSALDRALTDFPDHPELLRARTLFAEGRPWTP